MKRRWLLALVLSAATIGPAALPAASVPRVVVQDGDSLRIGETRIRLYGIDAPERDQTCTTPQGQTWACGSWAKARLASLVRNQRVQCADLGADRYGRRLSRCTVNGQDIAAQMVAEGAAIAYRKYAPDYIAHEAKARTEGRGIWAAGPQTTPEAHRHTARPLTGLTPPSAVTSNGTCLIKGNISEAGRVYHRPGQEYYDKTTISPLQGEAWFCTPAEAEAAGFRAAKR